MEAFSDGLLYIIENDAHILFLQAGYGRNLLDRPLLDNRKSEYREYIRGEVLFDESE